MRPIRFLLVAVLLSLSSLALAQVEHKMDAPKSVAPKSEAQVSFDTLKTLAGDWEGSVKTDFPGIDPMANIPMHLTMRVTSRGNVIVHEFQVANTPLDAAKYDHPVTMMYVDNDQLNLIHYCDAGNRPRMTAKLSPDGKKVEFTFVDISGSNKFGHMHHSIFTFVDADHHIEDWTFNIKTKDGSEKPIQAHFDLHRVAASASAGTTGGGK